MGSLICRHNKTSSDTSSDISSDTSTKPCEPPINIFHENKQDQNVNINNFNDKTFENTKKISLENIFTPARVVDIYDADTITLIIPIFGNYFKFQVRLSGIDTCELKSHNEQAKQLAYKARNRLFELITGTTIENTTTRKQIRESLNLSVYLVNILCGDFEKYGRLLGLIFHPNTINTNIQGSINHILVNEKLAYLYQGETKLTETEQVKLLCA